LFLSMPNMMNCNLYFYRLIDVLSSNDNYIVLKIGTHLHNIPLLSICVSIGIIVPIA
jgi:hypothetical protein